MKIRTFLHISLLKLHALSTIRFFLLTASTFDKSDGIETTTELELDLVLGGDVADTRVEPTACITPDDVLEFTEPTDDYLCPMAANIFRIEFIHFKILDYDSKMKIFEVGANLPPSPRSVMTMTNTDRSDPNAYRKARYNFSDDVLRLSTIQTSSTFKVGPQEVSKFRMIERHYFRNELVKSYDFTFGFCFPNSTNSWDAVYSMPPLEDGLIEKMVAEPYATTSDSFYFAGETLVMHNKAEYRYTPEDRAQAKKSDLNDGTAFGSDVAESKAADAKAEAKYEEKWSKEDEYET